MKPSQCRGIWENLLEINASIMLIYEIKTKEPLLCAITRLIYRKCECVCVRGREEAASLLLLTPQFFLKSKTFKLPFTVEHDDILQMQLAVQGSTFLLIFSVNVNDSQFGKKRGKISAHKREAVAERSVLKSIREAGRESFIIAS